MILIGVEYIIEFKLNYKCIKLQGLINLCAHNIIRSTKS